MLRRSPPPIPPPPFFGAQEVNLPLQPGMVISSASTSALTCTHLSFSDAHASCRHLQSPCSPDPRATSEGMELPGHSSAVFLASSTCLHTGISAHLMPWLLCPVAPSRFLGTHPATLRLSHTTRSLVPGTVPCTSGLLKMPDVL